MRFFSALAVILLTAGGAATQERRPIVASDLYELRFATDVDVSPDGRWVAYVVSRADSASNSYHTDLWLAASDGSDHRRLTWTDDAAVSSPRFSPDGTALAFVSRRDGDAHEQIYLLPLAGGGEARRLTDLPTGATNPTWSRSGQRLAFNSRVPPEASDESAGAAGTGSVLAANAAQGDPVVLTRLNFKALASLREERWTQIFVIDVEPHDAEPDQLTSGPFPHSGLSWSADDGLILYSASRSRGDYHPDYEVDSDVWAIPARPGSQHAEFTGHEEIDARLLQPGVTGRWDVERPGQGAETGASYSPSGDRIAYLRRSLESAPSARHADLYVAGADGAQARCVSCALDRSVGTYAWDGSDRLYFTVADRGAVPLYRVGAEGGDPVRLVDGDRGVLGFAVGGRTLAWIETSPANPSEIRVARLDGSDERVLTTMNEDFLASVHVRPYEEVQYEAPDGTPVQGWVIHPPGFRRGEHPLAVEIHGGPHGMWGPGEQTMWHEYQMLAGAGYVVFFANPRGSDGYGFDWKDAIRRDWGNLPMGDVLAGADRAREQAAVPVGREVVTGGSYGGYLTAWIIGQTDRFAAAVAQRGVYDMFTWYGGSFTWRLYESEFGTTPFEDPMLAWNASPLAHVANIETPLLLIHGERDYTATIAGAELLYRALKVLGKEVEFAWYPRASHELSRSGEPKQRVDRLMRIREFFDRHVMPAAGEADPR